MVLRMFCVMLFFLVARQTHPSSALEQEHFFSMFASKPGDINVVDELTAEATYDLTPWEFYSK